VSSLLSLSVLFRGMIVPSVCYYVGLKPLKLNEAFTTDFLNTAIVGQSTLRFSGLYRADG